MSLHSNQILPSNVQCGFLECDLLTLEVLVVSVTLSTLQSLLWLIPPCTVQGSFPTEIITRTGSSSLQTENPVAHT